MSTTIPPPEKPEKGWIEKLAERSAGLPQADGKNQDPAEDRTSSQAWKFAGLGIQFAVTVALFAFMGYQLDKWRGWTSNQALITLSLIAVIGNMYLLIKEGMKANK